MVANRPIEDGMVDSALLYREEIGLAAHTDVPLKSVSVPSHNYPMVEIEELRNLPFILVKHGQNLRQCIDEIFEAYDLHPNIVLETNNLDTCYRMVAQNMGVTIIPHTAQYTGQADHNILRYSLPGCHYRDIRIYWSKRGYLSASLRHFIACCQKVFSDADIKI